MSWFDPYIIGLTKWLNPESTWAKTVEVVCFIEFTEQRKFPASLTKNFPGSKARIKSLPYSSQKSLNLFESFTPNSSILVSLSPGEYGTLKPLPKSMNSNSLNLINEKPYQKLVENYSKNLQNTDVYTFNIN